MSHNGDLVQRVYEQLRRAAGRLAASSDLQATELVHEAWAKLDGKDFEGATHYRAVASIAMRQIVMDRARAAKAQKRAGVVVTLTDVSDAPRQLDLVALNEVLEQLEQQDPRAYQIVCMRYLGGLTAQEVAEHLNISRRTVQTTWRLARTWLVTQLG